MPRGSHKKITVADLSTTCCNSVFPLSTPCSPFSEALILHAFRARKIKSFRKMAGSVWVCGRCPHTQGTCKKIKSQFLREQAGSASLLSQKLGFY